jgi:hypothetical protein
MPNNDIAEAVAADDIRDDDDFAPKLRRLAEPTPFSDLINVAEIDLGSEPYGFHLGGIFFDPYLQKFWWGTDSGCSCPSPWDYKGSTADLEGPYTINEVLSVMLRCPEGSASGREPYPLRARRLARQLLDNTIPTGLAA